MSFDTVGIVEGFYGTPWSWDARAEVVSAWGDAGGTHYLYAPKDDPLHRARWRDPYPGDFLAEFARLADTAAAAGVDVGVAVSPGLDARYREAGDFDALRRKLEAFAAAGATHVSLAFDDVAPVFPHAEDAERYGAHPEGLAAAQADWANRVLALGLGPVWLCPTDYIGTEPTPYLDRLGTELDAAVGVGWTGSSVVSPRIRVRDAARRAATLRRRLVVWDNHPVNDTMMRSSLHLGPLQGRDPDLDRHVSGFYWNPMPQARASLVPLLTAAEYARDASAYDPGNAWVRAVARVGGDQGAALEVVADACRLGPLEPVASPAFAALCDAGVDALGTPGWEAPWRELDAYGTAAEAAPAALAASPLRDELAPWTEQLGRLAGVVRAAAFAVRSLHAGGLDFTTVAVALGGLAMSWQQTFDRTEQVWGQRLGLYPGLVQDAGGDGYGIDADLALVWDACHVDRLVRAVLSFAGRRRR